MDIAGAAALNSLLEREQPERVFHLAAQARVRYSIENPAAYIHSNIAGFAAVLESCRREPPRHLLFASSSVYGNNAKLPMLFARADRRQADLDVQPGNMQHATSTASMTSSKARCACSTSRRPTRSTTSATTSRSRCSITRSSVSSACAIVLTVRTTSLPEVLVEGVQ